MWKGDANAEISVPRISFSNLSRSPWVVVESNKIIRRLCGRVPDSTAVASVLDSQSREWEFKSPPR